MQAQAPSIQTVLENDIVKLVPLASSDFEMLYQIASDPKIWEQHPNKDRYKQEVFQTFFDGAIESKGAFKIFDKRTNEWAGSTRYYDFNAAENAICIGYTFYGTKFWGTCLNPQVKKVMLDYIFQYVDKVQLHVGATNFRSQTAVKRLGALKVGETEIPYFGEAPKLNYIYEILNPKLV